MKRKIFLIFAFVLAIVGSVYAKDPLPSWNETPAKKRIIQFVLEATNPNGENFIPIKDRVATFDQDGTLWVEQPIYTQFTFAFDKLKYLAASHPEWQNEEPFMTILNGQFEKLRRFTKKDIHEILAITNSGMTIEAYHAEVAHWLKNTLHPRYQRPYTELIYKPMLELMEWLRENHFDVYIVSGGGQEFIRTYSKEVYGVSPSNVVGTPSTVQYTYIDGQPALIMLPDVLFIDDKTGKPEGINLIIGRRPVAAFGNSIGDRQMLEWTQANKHSNLELLVHHDDPVREYAYGPESPIGNFSVALMEEAEKRGWIVVSMKNDWKVIFPWEKKQ